MIISSARCSRECLSTPCISSGNATFPITVKCGNRAKCWNTMPILWRLISFSSAFDMACKFCPSNSTLPVVDSINLERQRTSVDLPEPDNPMMTKISPSSISTVASHTAAMSPAWRKSCGVGEPPCWTMNCLALLPNTFQTLWHESFTLVLAVSMLPKFVLVIWFSRYVVFMLTASESCFLLCSLVCCHQHRNSQILESLNPALVAAVGNQQIDPGCRKSCHTVTLPKFACRCQNHGL